MLNNILLAAAVTIPVTPLCAPILAEEVTSSKLTTTIAASPTQKSGANQMWSMVALGETGNTPPAMALYEVGVANNIACRNAARAKFFELGARDMSPSDSNSQWATIGNMRAIAWCRDTRVIISVAGYNYNSVAEVRDVMAKAF